MSSSEIVVATSSATSTSRPRLELPPPSEVSAATTSPVIRLISGSATSSRVRSETAQKSVRWRGERAELMSIRTGRIPASTAR